MNREGKWVSGGESDVHLGMEAGFQEAILTAMGGLCE